MPTAVTIDSRRTAPSDWLTAAFLLAFPSIAMLVQGASSAVSIGAGVISLTALCSRPAGAPYGYAPLERRALALCIALCGPVAAVALSTLSHGHPMLRTWDSPSRFLLAIPIFLALRRAPPRIFVWADLSFTLGALSALALALFTPRDWGDGRIGSAFLNPIHFGDLALALGILSAIALNWWRKDSVLWRALKIAGLFGGLAASLLSGARGGWAAIPLVALLVVWELGRSKPLHWKVLMPVVVALLLGLVYGLSGTVRDRVNSVSSDLTQYTQGHRDTSVGIRLQLYEAAATLIAEHPVLGLGGDGFRDKMTSMAKQGALTPTAAAFGEGEVHNELLAYMANYGIVGGLALLGIYIVPAVFFAARLKSASRTTRRTALMGLSFVLMFFVFGLTVETFDLKSTVSFYATMLAVLAAITERTDVKTDSFEG
ncbi:O-antigen ligase family protein [Paraburkholderia silvatlantica]|uniref:O-antigen ligase n=1 Tax=Paraburkholderia silvatlantica TaxID=321895 RepID=A0ABR6G1Q7_9BURK|nr:O-antigen ligase [Paraburkholderia silvatlantica]MBB2932714.1 O-antigen ligase [Paraburkholderia silvatlantica]PVY21464.1 O-antigen ligase [Paraburkholderia silvatlantica]PXW26061.1 O-antigen ligase [Paraburkholderia silvatlantica]